MATKRELERHALRKTRLIEQNDLHRQSLAAESDNLRQVANLVEKGHGFYQATRRLRTWVSPLLIIRSRKKSVMQKIVSGSKWGLKLFQKWREG